MANEPTHKPAQTHPAAGLGNAAMVLGIVTTVGAVLLWFVVQGMVRESRGRGIESVDDEGASLFGAIGCVAGEHLCRYASPAAIAEARRPVPAHAIEPMTLESGRARPLARSPESRESEW